jgi:hypothetical protein
MKNYKEYKPEFLGLLIAIGILNLWYLSGIAVEEAIIPKNYDHLLRLVTVAVGGFIGAYSAFWLKKSEESNKTQREKKLALDRCLFNIGQQRNAIEMIVKDFDKFKTPMTRAFNLRAIKPPNYDGLRQDINTLSFILESDDPLLLMDITIEQQCFEQGMHAIELRNNFYVERLQPEIAFKQLHKQGKEFNYLEAEKELGEYFFRSAIDYSNNMYDLTYENRNKLKDLSEKLLEFCKKEFPNEKFVVLKFPD